MRIELQPSPSSFVVLSNNVFHLQAFKVRHCLNPQAKMWYTTQMFQLNLQNSFVLQKSANGMNGHY